MLTFVAPASFPGPCAFSWPLCALRACSVFFLELPVCLFRAATHVLRPYRFLGDFCALWRVSCTFWQRCTLRVPLCIFGASDTHLWGPSMILGLRCDFFWVPARLIAPRRVVPETQRQLSGLNAIFVDLFWVFLKSESWPDFSNLWRHVVVSHLDFSRSGMLFGVIRNF